MRTGVEGSEAAACIMGGPADRVFENADPSLFHHRDLHPLAAASTSRAAMGR